MVHGCFPLEGGKVLLGAPQQFGAYVWRKRIETCSDGKFVAHILLRILPQRVSAVDAGKRIQISDFMSCSLRSGRTDMKKLIVDFRNFTKSPQYKVKCY